MVQPLLVSISALTLATETVRSILKIDDVVREPQQRFWANPERRLHGSRLTPPTRQLLHAGFICSFGRLTPDRCPAAAPAVSARDPGLRQHTTSTVDVRLLQS